MTDPTERWWSSALGPHARVLVLAPHPDDETLGCGGLLARAVAHGAAVRVLVVTDGENNPWAQRAAERRWRVGEGDQTRWGARRRDEAVAAVATLGIDPAAIRFLGFADKGLTALLLRGGGGLIEDLAAEIVDFAPTLVVAPDLGDRHPDHSALAVLLALACECCAGRARFACLAYLVHGKLGRGGRVQLSLDPATRGRKRHAIFAHASQLAALVRRIAPPPRRETFLPPRTRAGHPVRRAVVRGTTLRLEIAMPRPRLPLRTTWLHVVADGDGPVTSWSLAVPAYGTRATIEAGTAPGRRVGTASIRRTPSRAEVALPLRLFDGARRLFVKLERRGIFFDAVGWRIVPLNAQTGADVSQPYARASAGVVTPTALR